MTLIHSKRFLQGSGPSKGLKKGLNQFFRTLPYYPNTWGNVKIVFDRPKCVL